MYVAYPHKHEEFVISNCFEAHGTGTRSGTRDVQAQGANDIVYLFQAES